MPSISITTLKLLRTVPTTSSVAGRCKAGVACSRMKDPNCGNANCPEPTRLQRVLWLGQSHVLTIDDFGLT